MFHSIGIKKLTLILLAAVGLMATFSVPAQSTAKQPVRIGVTLPLSGPLAVNGRNYQNAINLAVKKINADGGILKGTPVEVMGRLIHHSFFPELWDVRNDLTKMNLPE